MRHIVQLDSQLALDQTSGEQVEHEVLITIQAGEEAIEQVSLDAALPVILKRHDEVECQLVSFLLLLLKLFHREEGGCILERLPGEVHLLALGDLCVHLVLETVAVDLFEEAQELLDVKPLRSNHINVLRFDSLEEFRKLGVLRIVEIMLPGAFRAHISDSCRFLLLEALFFILHLLLHEHGFDAGLAFFVVVVHNPGAMRHADGFR